MPAPRTRAELISAAEARAINAPFSPDAELLLNLAKALKKTEGPASAATDPDHDPNNPCKENAVSEQQPTPVPAVPATPNPLQPFKDFAFNIEGEMLQVRAEIIACHEMLSPRSAIEHDVREAIDHLVASAYARLDRIRDAHRLAFETAKKRGAA